MCCHASVAHSQILNGASVILSPFIGVELTSWKARTLPQVAAGFDPQQNFMILTFAKRHQRAARRELRQSSPASERHVCQTFNIAQRICALPQWF
jgi:hypothetical protein